MTEFVRMLLDILYALCPVRYVWEWQEGVYYVCGRSWGRVGPGPKLVVPGVCEVKLVNMSEAIYSTPLQTITLRDKTTLTYSASITVLVRDSARAYHRVEHYAETVVELVARVLSDELADADPERFDAAQGRRSKLLKSLKGMVNEQCVEYGLEVTELGFTNFVRGVRTFRVLTDKAVLTAEPQGLV